MKKPLSKEAGGIFARSTFNFTPCFQGNSQEYMARFRHQAAVPSSLFNGWYPSGSPPVGEALFHKRVNTA